MTFFIFYLKGGKNQFLNVTKNLFLSDWYMMAKRKLVGGGLMNYSVKNSSYYNEIHKIINYNLEILYWKSEIKPMEPIDLRLVICELEEKLMKFYQIETSNCKPIKLFLSCTTRLN